MLHSPIPAFGGKMRRVILSFSTTLAIFASLLLFMMMIITVSDIASRTFTGRSLPGAHEISEQLVVALIFLGMALAFYRKEHVALTVFTRIIPVLPRTAIICFGHLILLFLVLWMVKVTAETAWLSFARGEYRFGLLRVPIWPAKMTIPIGLASLALQVFCSIVGAFSDFQMIRYNNQKQLKKSL